MADEITRGDDSAFSLPVATLENIGQSGVLSYKGMAGGEVHVLPGTAGLNLLTWHVSHDGKPEHYVPAKDADGNAVTQAVDGVNGGGYPIPDALFGAHHVKPTGNVAAVVHLTMKG